MSTSTSTMTDRKSGCPGISSAIRRALSRRKHTSTSSADAGSDSSIEFQPTHSSSSPSSTPSTSTFASPNGNTSRDPTVPGRPGFSFLRRLRSGDATRGEKKNANKRVITSRGKTKIQDVPGDCLARVMAHLEPHELRTVAAVCRRWRRVAAAATARAVAAGGVGVLRKGNTAPNPTGSPLTVGDVITFTAPGGRSGLGAGSSSGTPRSLDPSGAVSFFASLSETGNLPQAVNLEGVRMNDAAVRDVLGLYRSDARRNHDRILAQVARVRKRMAGKGSSDNDRKDTGGDKGDVKAGSGSRVDGDGRNDSNATTVAEEIEDADEQRQPPPQPEQPPRAMIPTTSGQPRPIETAVPHESITTMYRALFRALSTRQTRALLAGGISHGLPSSVTLAHCPNVTWVSLSHIARNLGPALRSLSLVHCAKLNDAALRQIAEHCPLLADLDISGCHRITDTGTSDLIGACGSSLRKFAANGCSRLGEGTLRALAECGNLEVLDLSGCPGVTGTGLEMVASGAAGGSLSVVRLDFCTRLAGVGWVRTLLDRAASGGIQANSKSTIRESAVGAAGSASTAGGGRGRGLRELSLRNCRALDPMELLRGSLTRGGHVGRIIGSRAPPRTVRETVEAIYGPGSAGLTAENASVLASRARGVSAPSPLERLCLRGLNLSAANPADWSRLMSSCPSLVTLDLGHSGITRESIGASLRGAPECLRIVDVSGVASWNSIAREYQGMGFKVVSLDG